MAAVGVNSLRTYTPPPAWLLDEAAEHGLYVLVGLPWEQHVTFLDDRARVRSIVERVRRSVEAVSGHPAVLAYSVGNEIPASITRIRPSASTAIMFLPISPNPPRTMTMASDALTHPNGEAPHGPLERGQTRKHGTRVVGQLNPGHRH